MSYPYHQQQQASSSSLPQPPDVDAAVIRQKTKNRDLLALQAFVTAKDAHPYEHVHATTVLLDLTHSNLIQRHIEIRFDLKDTLDTLRQRITQKTGTPASMQHLQMILYGQVVWDLPPHSPYEQHPLGFFGLEHGTQVHCIDLDPHSQSRHGGYEDVTLVPKYVMTEEEYAQRSNTLRHWKRQQQEQNPNFTLEGHAQQHAALAKAKKCHRLGVPLPRGFQYDAVLQQVVLAVDAADETEASTTTTNTNHDNDNDETVPPHHIQVGQRCEVQPGGRRGVVKFVGIIPNMGGTKNKNMTSSSAPPPSLDDNDGANTRSYWIGVQFDEPVGKSDGSFRGKQYFDVPPHYGGFCLPRNVQVGDFPERDIFDEDDDDEVNRHNANEQDDDDEEDEL